MSAIDPTRTMRILLSWVSFMPSTNYQGLLVQWDKHKIKCGADVIEGLASQSLMTFEVPIFEELE